jgi:hypothetical protein
MMAEEVRFHCTNCGWEVWRRTDRTDPTTLKAANCADSCDEALEYEYRRC